VTSTPAGTTTPWAKAMNIQKLIGSCATMYGCPWTR
jgi:hypothetical protein